MPTAVASITERVRERLRQGGVDLAARPEAAGTLVREEVRRYAERALAGDGPLLGDEPGTARQVLAQLTGYGPLQPLFDDPSVEEIWVKSPKRGGLPLDRWIGGPLSLHLDPQSAKSPREPR